MVTIHEERRSGSKGRVRGHWEVESAHFTHAVPPITARAFMHDFPAGLRAGLADVGALLEGLEFTVVDGFVYSRPKPVGGPADAAVPPKVVFQVLLRAHPVLRRRLRRAGTVWERKPWLTDVERWDGRVKPDIVARARALQQQRVESMTDDALLEHLRRAELHLRRAVWTHARFTAAAALPLGDLIAHIERWTGLDGAAALARIVPVDRLAAARSDRLGPAADAVRSDPAALRLLLQDEAAGLRLEKLRASAAARPVSDWLDEVGDRIACGYDYANPRLLEVPELLIQQLRTAVQPAPPPTLGGLEELRALVPPEHRPEFDDLVAQARAVLHLRDERVLYCDSWANGLLRRGLLEAGSRLAERGRIGDPEDAIDAEIVELSAGLLGDGPFDRAALAQRAAWRRSKRIDDVPSVLGGPAPTPPPVDWLPQPVRRLHEAIAAGMGAVLEDGNRPHDGTRLRGIPVSAGIAQGTARILDGPEDLRRLRVGDVLVARSTSPAFNAALPTITAIVTDRGGALSHAAIVAREYGIPGVVGTRDATRRIPDGSLVRVDGTAGEVVLLS